MHNIKNHVLFSRSRSTENDVDGEDLGGLQVSRHYDVTKAHLSSSAGSAAHKGSADQHFGKMTFHGNTVVDESDRDLESQHQVNHH